MFSTACPSEMLPTLWLNTGILSILMGSVQVRWVMFTTGLCPFQVRSVSVHGLSGGGVLVLKKDWMASFSRQDGNSIGQDEKCNQQAMKSITGRFPGGESHSPDAESWRVSEI